MSVAFSGGRECVVASGAIASAWRRSSRRPPWPALRRRRFRLGVSSSSHSGAPSSRVHWAAASVGARRGTLALVGVVPGALFVIAAADLVRAAGGLRRPTPPPWWAAAAARRGRPVVRDRSSRVQLSAGGGPWRRGPGGPERGARPRSARSRCCRSRCARALERARGLWSVTVPGAYRGPSARAGRTWPSGLAGALSWLDGGAEAAPLLRPAPVPVRDPARSRSRLSAARRVRRSRSAAWPGELNHHSLARLGRHRHCLLRCCAVRSGPGGRTARPPRLPSRGRAGRPDPPDRAEEARRLARRSSEASGDSRGPGCAYWGRSGGIGAGRSDAAGQAAGPTGWRFIVPHLVAHHEHGDRHP